MSVVKNKYFSPSALTTIESASHLGTLSHMETLGESRQQQQTSDTKNLRNSERYVVTKSSPTVTGDIFKNKDKLVIGDEELVANSNRDSVTRTTSSLKSISGEVADLYPKKIEPLYWERKCVRELKEWENPDSAVDCMKSFVKPAGFFCNCFDKPWIPVWWFCINLGVYFQSYLVFVLKIFHSIFNKCEFFIWIFNLFLSVWVCMNIQFLLISCISVHTLNLCTIFGHKGAFFGILLHSWYL